jgi:putative acetyltransferase
MHKYTFLRTNSENKDFQNLVAALDEDLAIRDGDEHPFFAQFNKLDSIKYVIVAYDAAIAVGCGAIKQYDDCTMEVKRMFVPTEYRGKGIASFLLTELETWAIELSHTRCILETGKKQFEAVKLYHKSLYSVIPNYGQYHGVESSVCFEKRLV